MDYPKIQIFYSFGHIFCLPARPTDWELEKAGGGVVEISAWNYSGGVDGNVVKEIGSVILI